MSSTLEWKNQIHISTALARLCRLLLFLTFTLLSEVWSGSIPCTVTSKEQKAEKHNIGSAVPTKLRSVSFYFTQLQQLILLTVNDKHNTLTRGDEERSENALCVLRRCCLDELLSAQRAQSSSHASLQLPPPGGAGERNVVMSLLLHD